jgi:hypothetical protein
MAVSAISLLAIYCGGDSTSDTGKQLSYSSTKFPHQIILDVMLILTVAVS